MNMIEKIKKLSMENRKKGFDKTLTDDERKRAKIGASVLGVLLNDLEYKKVAVGKKGKELTDSDCMKNIVTMVDGNKEMLRGWDAKIKNDADKTDHKTAQDMLDVLVIENEYLDKLLPSKLTGDELKDMIAVLVAELGITDIKGMGIIMGKLKPTGKLIDGSEVRKVLSELL